jgi:DNA anti-recombination protein RmuC
LAASPVKFEVDSEINRLKNLISTQKESEAKLRENFDKTVTNYQKTVKELKTNLEASPKNKERTQMSKVTSPASRYETASFGVAEHEPHRAPKEPVVPVESRNRKRVT